MVGNVGYMVGNVNEGFYLVGVGSRVCSFNVAVDGFCDFSSFLKSGSSRLKHLVHNAVAGEVEPQCQDCWYARGLVGSLRVVAFCALSLTSVMLG